MRILAVGGGSGGHVTPVAAIVKHLKQKQPSSDIRFWTDRSFFGQARAIMNNVDKSIRVRTVISGKLRRYHHLTRIQHILSPVLVAQNIRDGFFVLVGILQSFVMLIVWRPDVIFTKGGYVCMPVGIAAAILRIPLVIHDSDAHPGLTNRVLAKWASVIATGAPLEYYAYPSSRSVYVGIPIDESFRPYTEAEKAQAKRELSCDADRKLIVITGGGLGAMRINTTVLRELKRLEKLGDVLLITGEANYAEISVLAPKSKHIHIVPFVSSGMAQILGASDVVIARAGATTILELAAVGTPTILIPNAQLTGGHQVKNAAVYRDAVVILDEETMLSDERALEVRIRDIFTNSRQTQEMTERFRRFARPHATEDMASIILKAAK